MRTKPFFARLIAIGLFIVPFELFFRLEMARQQYHLTYTLENLMPILSFSTIAWVIGYGVWKVRLWGFWGLMIYGLTSTGYDLSYIVQGKMQFTYWTAVDFSAAVLGLSLILLKKVRAPYFSPKIRWWEQATRYRVDIQGKFFIGEQTVQALILDISTSGCFASCDFNVAESALIRLEISLNDIVFSSDAQFIRRSENPKGVGIKFINTSKANQKSLRKLLSQLVKKADILR